MTSITLHGILAKEFGESFKMKIYKAANVIKAIDVNRKNFNKRIFELSREGFNYTMIVDGKKITELEELNIQREPQEIHLVPLIIGSGGVIIAGAIFGAAAVTAGGVAGFVAGAINMVIISVVSMGLQMLLAPKPEAPAPISASTKALTESFAFSNKANLATQGSPVPIGYARLKVGAQVIQMTIKSYQQNQDSTSSMQQNAYIDTNLNLLPDPQSNSSKV
jgi:predicted phage tail protein